MTITAFELLTVEQRKPFFRFSQLGPVLQRARRLVEAYALTQEDVDRLTDAAYWIIDDYKALIASNGICSITKQFDLPFDPDPSKSLTPLKALEALSVIREEEPGLKDGKSIELAADTVLREIYRPGVAILEEAVHAYDFSEIHETPSLVFLAYAAEELALDLEIALEKGSYFSPTTFTALEAVEAVNHAEKLMLINGAITQYQEAKLETLSVSAKLTKGYARSLALINKAKAAATERAQTIAVKLWQADTAEQIRIGDMAEMVYRALEAEGFSEALPETEDRIKEWIKPIAPGYARKPGRRRKSPLP